MVCDWKKRSSCPRDDQIVKQYECRIEVNRAWPGRPNLFKYSNSGQVPQEEKDADIKNYPSSYLFGDGFLRTFASYYKNKNVCYIQIQGLGLYHLGRDPLGLAKIGVSNILNSGAKMKLRIRTKTSASAGTYRFSTNFLMDRNPVRLDLIWMIMNNLLYYIVMQLMPESLQHHLHVNVSSSANQ